MMNMFPIIQKIPHATKAAPQSMKLLALILIVKILYSFKVKLLLTRCCHCVILNLIKVSYDRI